MTEQELDKIISKIDFSINDISLIGQLVDEFKKCQTVNDILRHDFKMLKIENAKLLTKVEDTNNNYDKLLIEYHDEKRKHNDLACEYNRLKADYSHYISLEKTRRL